MIAMLTLVYLIGFLATWPVVEPRIHKEVKKVSGGNMLVGVLYALGLMLLWPTFLFDAVRIRRG